MPTIEDLKRAVCARIDERRDDIVALSAEVLAHPESGYREQATARRVAERLAGMGLEPRMGLAGTGVKANLRGRSSRRKVAILGELDSLIVPDHPHADPATGAAHACGHNAQVASMYGAGLGLQAVMDQLDGDVVLFAVPAEECIELAWRIARRDAGDIEFLLGKPELIRLGEFDDVDMALITHASSEEGRTVRVDGSANGSLIKLVTFHGVAAHAGNSPEVGVNALKAATLAIAAIDAQRDTFRDGDGVRISHIIVNGGAAVSAVPAEVTLEIMVRARTVDAMADAAAKVDRALRAGCVALGASVDIRTFGAYLPLRPDAALVEVAARNAGAVVGEDAVIRDPGAAMGGSTDVGDLGMIMPVAHPMSACGSTAPFHGNAFWTVDHDLAAVGPAKFMATAVVDLLADGAGLADRVVAESGPKLGRDEYLALRRGLDGHESFDGALPRTVGR
jgi:amidohydrolase